VRQPEAAVDLAYLYASDTLLCNNLEDKTPQMSARWTIIGQPKTPKWALRRGCPTHTPFVTQLPKACTRLLHAVFMLASFTIWFAVHYLRKGGAGRKSCRVQTACQPKYPVLPAHTATLVLSH